MSKIQDVKVTLTAAPSTHTFNFKFKIEVGFLSFEGDYSRGMGHGELVRITGKESSIPVLNPADLYCFKRMYTNFSNGKNKNVTIGQFVKDINSALSYGAMSQEYGFACKHFDPLEILASVLCDAECFEGSEDIDDYASTYCEGEKISEIQKSWDACRDAAIFLYRAGFKLDELAEELETLKLY